MGNEQPKKNNEVNQEFYTFELIQDALNLKNPILFRKYLKEVFNDLANSTESNATKYLSRMAFYDYIKLPIFIAEKLFTSFTNSSSEGLSEKEFVEGFFNLYMGSFEETIAVIFNLIDFNKDGNISKEDAKMILSYLPLNEPKEVKSENNLVSRIFGAQIKSLEEIDSIVSSTFDKYGGQMNLNQFTKIVTEENSEIFLQILCFLYEQIPFNSKNIEALKNKYNLMNDDDYEQICASFQNHRKSGSIRIKAPKRYTLLSPASTFLRKFRVRKLTLTQKSNESITAWLKTNKIFEEKKENDNMSINSSLISSSSLSFNPKLEDPDDNEIKLDFSDDESSNKKTNEQYLKNIDIVRLNNDSILEKGNKLESNENIKDLVEHSKKRYTSPSRYLQDKSYINHLAISNSLTKRNSQVLDNQLRPINETDGENEKEKEKEKGEENNIKCKEEENDRNILYENWVYKITQSQKIKKYYLVLVNKDVYYYKAEDKKEFIGMHNLSGCFVQETNEKKILDNIECSSFEIFSKNKSKTRRYYTTDPKISKEFVEKIKKAIGYVKFSDLYEMKEVIGKGKFGVVNLGIHKKTGQQVAIKILNKENLKTAEDKELVQIEIGILKLCHHPNIVRLLDHLENTDYIYIVTEYIEGGTLSKYLKKKKFNFSERQASYIMIQIASAVKYLHQYGIVHRDLKPGNIMITQQNDFGIIKIMDFGLSKIVSPSEKMIEGYGTLSYVAPEVLLRTPYNKEVDIWSMGVILYYMLSGNLPFRGMKQQEVAEKIIYEDLEFDDDEWETKTQKVQDLISRCLEKNPKDRITIDEFIEHPWFKKKMNQKLSI